MTITNDLIRKFFAGSLSLEDASAILEYLKSNPEDAFLLEEWNNIDRTGNLPKNYSTQMLAFILESIMHENKGTQ